LEEQRIGRMYWNLFTKRMIRIWDSLFPRGLLRSSALPVIVVFLLIGIPGLGYYLHERGEIHRLKTEIQGESQNQVPAGPRPGGVDPIVLERAKTGNGPEFLSATLLPGLGMSVLQITANLPGRGEIPLLAAPSVEEVASGTVTPKVGQNDSRGAFEVPWGGSLGGQLSPVGTIRVSWKNHMLEAPTDVLAHGVAVGGLLCLQGGDAGLPGTERSTQATATFSGTDFDGHWISKTDVSVNVQMQAQTMVLTVTAKNVGDQPEPMGIGWHPRFVVAGNDRDQTEVRIPNGQQLDISDSVKGLPSGRMLSPGASMARLQSRAAALGAEGIDENVVNPKGDLSEEMRDPAAGYGIRLTALSSSIQAMRVVSPSGSNYVSLGAQTNYDDPLGKEWDTGDKAAIAILQPGQSLEWKVKLEIFAVGKK
jgi:hypothetical protein